MRQPSSATISYVAEATPPEYSQVYFRDELGKLAAVIQALALGQLDKSFVAPAKPREGMIRLADGTRWNPGSGAGVYAYYNGAWRILG